MLIPSPAAAAGTRECVLKPNILLLKGLRKILTRSFLKTGLFSLVSRERGGKKSDICFLAFHVPLPPAALWKQEKGKKN